MDPTQGSYITFSPDLITFSIDRGSKASTVLSGPNNSGKSLALKHLKQAMGRSAYMVGTNRFYHVYHIAPSLADPFELENFEQNFRSNFLNEQYNFEQNFIDLNRILTGMSDTQRGLLFELCGELIGAKFSLKKVDPNSDLSYRYIDVDGLNVSVASTGTRLLMTLLGICMDTRFSAILIDEPELGLSPRVQRSLSDFLHNEGERSRYFPHLKQVILSTHSNLFLNRRDLSSNFIVSKSGSNVRLTAVGSIADFHRLQFNLLGNSLEGLFLPAAIVYVEGITDQQYLECVLSQRFPGRNIVVAQVGGDGRIREKLHGLSVGLGGLQKSPLRSRVFVIVDSVHNKGLGEQLVKQGLPPENFIVWDNNGVEHIYPSSVIAELFSCHPSSISGLSIDGDRVTLNGVTLTKADLCDAVIKRMCVETQLPKELTMKLLEPLQKAIGD